MEEIKISCDVDGVFAHFYKDVCERYGKEVEDITEFDTPWIGEIFHEIADDASFWMNMTKLVPPQDIGFDFDFYLTSLPAPMRNPRKIWLVSNGYPDREVIISHHKHEVVRDMGVHVHIDDKLETIENIANETDTVPILYLPYYLEYDVTRGKDIGVTAQGKQYQIFRDFKKLSKWIQDHKGILSVMDYQN